MRYVIFDCPRILAAECRRWFISIPAAVFKVYPSNSYKNREICKRSSWVKVLIATWFRRGVSKGNQYMSSFYSPKKINWFVRHVTLSLKSTPHGTPLSQPPPPPSLDTEKLEGWVFVADLSQDSSGGEKRDTVADAGHPVICLPDLFSIFELTSSCSRLQTRFPYFFPFLFIPFIYSFI